MGDGTTVAEIQDQQLVVTDDGSDPTVQTVTESQAVYDGDTSQISVTAGANNVIINGEDAEALALVVQTTEQTLQVSSETTYLLTAESDELLLNVEESTVLVEDAGGANTFPAAVRELFVQDDAPVGASAPYIWIETGLGGGSDWTIWFEDGS